MPLEGTYKPSDNPKAAWARDQAELYERTDGAEGGTVMGVPIVVITSRGAQSGYLRKNPVMRVEHGGEYLAVASRGGSRKHPGWYFNMVTHPLVELQDHAHLGDYTVRELQGEEREVWWDRAVEVFPPYAEYAKKTERLIPLLLLSPAGD